MLAVKDIFKTYEGEPLLKGVSLQVNSGETVCLLGPSGSGKTTLLRIIAGLEQADRGDVLWDGEVLTQTPVHQRHFGLMFQDYALFPHLDVENNIAFGLKMTGVDSASIKLKVVELLRQMNLSGFNHRQVAELSGGEQQRVALARALAPQPRLLMLDEPLGALDRSLREQLMGELRSLLHETGLPAIYVTHDQQEAFTIADRIILLNQGQIVQEGTPAEVYTFPINPWVAHFLGLVNLIQGSVMSLDPFQIKTGAGLFSPLLQPTGLTIGMHVTMVIRSDAVQIVTSEQPENSLQIRIDDVIFHGDRFLCKMKLP